MSNEMSNEGVAAVLGVVLLAAGGEVIVPASVVESGLPENSGVAVEFHEETGGLRVWVESQ